MPGQTAKYPPGPQRVQADMSLEDILWLLKRDGGVVLEKLVDRALVEQAIAEILPKLEADKPWAGSFFPGQTRRAPGLNGVSPTYTEHFLMHPLYQAVCRHFLTTTNSFWWGGERKTSVSLPQASACTAIQIGPGAGNQEIHRVRSPPASTTDASQDDYIHHNGHAAIDAWDDARDRNTREFAIGFFIAGSRTTKANGATRIIPGSHLWGNDRTPVEDNLFYAELDVGDAFLMLGSTYHGGSANTTTDEARLIFSAFCTRGVYRQEENQFLIVSPEQLKKFRRKTQRVLGWGISEPYLGWVDFQDPLKLYYPEEFDKAPIDLASGQAAQQDAEH